MGWVLAAKGHKTLRKYQSGFLMRTFFRSLLTPYLDYILAGMVNEIEFLVKLISNFFHKTLFYLHFLQDRQ